MDKVASSIKKVVRKPASHTYKSIDFKTSNLAKFADGSCQCSLGDTSVLVTAVCNSLPKDKSSKPPISHLPLSVDYRQKAAAAGRIPMTHLRRDIGVTEREILTSRVIDRSIRPVFPKNFLSETQIICNLLAVDGVHDPDVLAINGASASLAVSDIPWNGPVGAVRMGLIDNFPVANPTRREQEKSKINLIITATGEGNILMMDGSCSEPVLLPDIQRTIRVGIKECRTVIDSIVRLQKASGKPKRPLENTCFEIPQEQRDFVSHEAHNQIRDALMDHAHDKTSRDAALTQAREVFTSQFLTQFPASSYATYIFADMVKRIYREVLIETKTRCDGRKFSEMRPIKCQVDLYKPLHGSALFQRGLTQVFCSTTFDSPDAAFRTDTITLLTSGVKEKNFMLHYEFPPFATNEIGRVGTLPGRREIGHGALAEKAIRPVVPDEQRMTIRLNCEVLESNGSSSMASVSAGSMSLMDAGVKITDHVAGVAMGLFVPPYDPVKQKKQNTDTDENIILTDILGFEDYFGDMDFKIAGTRKGVTALQLDVKPQRGLPPTIVYQALIKTVAARSEIISKMELAIREPRGEQKENHPVIKAIRIPAHKRAKFLGFNGTNLKRLTAEIGVRISALESVDDGNVLGSPSQDNYTIFAPNKDAMEEAEEFIAALLESEFREPELDFNGIYSATIEEIRPTGLMVTLYPNMTPTLLPLSQLDTKKVMHPSALNFEKGQQIQVKYFGRDPSSGQMRLSRKSLLVTSTSRVHDIGARDEQGSQP